MATSPPFADWWGLAWAPSNEVWYAVEDSTGTQTPIYGLDLRARHRLVYRAPGSLTLHDISPHGDVLASFDHNVGHTELVDATDATPVDRTWRDGGRVAALTADRAMLLGSRGGSGGLNDSIYLWRPGGDPVAILPPELQPTGANQISPDGSRIVATTPPAASLCARSRPASSSPFPESPLRIA